MVGNDALLQCCLNAVSSTSFSHVMIVFGCDGRKWCPFTNLPHCSTTNNLSVMLIVSWCDGRKWCPFTALPHSVQPHWCDTITSNITVKFMWPVLALILTAEPQGEEQLVPTLSNSQPPDLKADTVQIEPLGQVWKHWSLSYFSKKMCCSIH